MTATHTLRSVRQRPGTPGIFAAVLATALALAGCAEKPPADWFVDATADSGLDFVHFNGMSGELYFPEMMGAGAALFDYDADGDLDLYLVQGTMLGPDKALDDAVFAPAHPPPLTDRLYRNDWTASDGVRYTDVTATAGQLGTGYGMGVAAGDYDNDGLVDLYVTNLGSNQLLRNEGGGRFRDVTAEAGADDPAWSVSASFADLDADGHLDLYVGNYVAFRLSNHKPCRSSTSARDYCSPLVYPPQPDRLLMNNGDGSFRDASLDAGIARVFGGALGVITADFDGDERVDVYVANDGVPNQLWINAGDGRFRETAALAGVGVNMDGSPEASMGVDAADFDGDGDEDLFMTHLTRESNTLYVNDGTGWFEDRTLTAGLASPSLAYTGFGTAWFDVDNDGRLDILSVNGAVTQIQDQVAAGDPFPLRQINQLFMNGADAAFDDATDRAGAAFALAEVSRGAAFGDVDNDGDVDVVITNNAGPARLLLNQLGSRADWLGLRLVTADGRRDALGARVFVETAGGTLVRRVRTDGSYASSRDPRIVVGLGEADDAVSVVVAWPDGRRARFEGLEVGTWHTLRQGTGEPVE